MDVMTEQEEEGLLPTRYPRVRLPAFEGPLDLLLFLIRKNEVDICDIPIERITEQYLEIIYKKSGELDLELTGDFFVMAATLMVIKSRMLLPKEKQGEEDEEEMIEEDPRWELVEQLLEYKRVKEEAQRLEGLIDERQDYLPRLYMSGDEGKRVRPLKDVDRMEIWQAFNRVLHRLSERMVVGEIHDEQVTVADRMEYMLKLLEERERFLFSELFEGKVCVNVVVASFLALLELTRMERVCLEQVENFSDIMCVRAGAAR